MNPELTRLATQLVRLGLALSCLAPAAFAQTVYKSLGTDGRVTFSDIPPAPLATGAPEQARTAAASRTGAEAATVALPLELRQASGRFPVTLYSASGCGPCVTGRDFLNARGIPFVEKTVNSADDTLALQRLSGDAALPLLTIGAQQLKGFTASEWTLYLDAATYPKTSQLPATYRNPAPTPLVAISRPAATTATPATPAEPSAVVSAPTPAAAQPAPAGSGNPAGIRF